MREKTRKSPGSCGIGVIPESLTDRDGVPFQTAGRVTISCKQLLESHDIFDFDCELKESHAGPTVQVFDPSS
jgi:hypothetical protein